VTLPPGRARLATRPVPTGSDAAAKTIGMTDVACFAAITTTVADVTMTSTLSRTNSAAISAARSRLPSAQPTRWLSAAGVAPPKYPMVGSFAGCCARAASGHAAAAPPRNSSCRWPGLIALAADLYEIDRREKSTFRTVTANLAEMEQCPP